MKKLSYLVVFAGLAISSTAFALDWGKHPHLQHAKDSINEAKKYLKEANDHEKSEFGGHRAAAEKLLDQAKGEIDQAAEWAETHKLRALRAALFADTGAISRRRNAQLLK